MLKRLHLRHGACVSILACLVSLVALIGSSPARASSRNSYPPPSIIAHGSSPSTLAPPPGGGGTQYGPDSPFFIQAWWFDPAGNVVTYRTGDSTWGMTHVIDKHDIVYPNAIALDVQNSHRSWDSEHQRWDYRGWVYNQSLWSATHVQEWSNILVVSDPTIKADGVSLGHNYCILSTHQRGLPQFRCVG